VVEMRKTIAVIATGALAAGIAAGPAGAAGEVSVKDDFFSPKSKSVAPGGSITWLWRGKSEHNVTGMTRSGRVVFRSKTTKRKGYRYTKRFSKAGSYRVICTLHDGMKMSVRVR
jgi:plastocyanin